MTRKKQPAKKHMGRRPKGNAQKNDNYPKKDLRKERVRTKKMTALLLDEKVMEHLRAFCKSSEWSMSGFIEEAIIEMLELDIKPTRRAKLSLQDRKEILLLHCDGYTGYQIAKLKNITPQTVYRTIDRFQKRYT